VISSPPTPERDGSAARSETTRRAIVNAIFYVAATGCQWRALPACYPNWNTSTATTHLEPQRHWERICDACAASCASKRAASPNPPRASSTPEASVRSDGHRREQRIRRRKEDLGAQDLRRRRYPWAARRRGGRRRVDERQRGGIAAIDRAREKSAAWRRSSATAGSSGPSSRTAEVPHFRRVCARSPRHLRGAPAALGSSSVPGLVDESPPAPGRL